MRWLFFWDFCWPAPVGAGTPSHDLQRHDEDAAPGRHLRFAGRPLGDVSATDVDLAKNTRTSHLWIIPIAGGTARALTDSMAGESQGRFSPDGKQILFESARNGGQQIWLADFDTANGTIGEPHKLTSLSTETDGAMWSPDSKADSICARRYIRIATTTPATKAVTTNRRNRW